jgi:UDP-hydrolysing UDP-N-acetyl-D-glucosamine 2-epimerase
MSDNKRKVCIVVNSRANYGRIKSVLNAIKNHPSLELFLIVGASALLSRFGNVRDIMERDGFYPNSIVYTIVEGENPTTMAKSTGLAIMELATIFENSKPDIVLTVADRFDTMATAIAASYMNIPLAHTQGGEVTGSIDESVRHAITKLSHIHFPATKRAYENVIRMGEPPETVFNLGCPAMDIILNIDLKISANSFEEYTGVGPKINFNKPYIVVLQHPVTTEYGHGYAQIKETLTAVMEIGIQTVWLWPNVDAGSDDISKGLREFRENNHNSLIHFYKNFAVEDYARLINNCVCLVGNSSSAIREGSLLGVPAVNVGTRQLGREHDTNIIHANYDRVEILNAIKSQIKHGRYIKSHLFGKGDAGKKIAEVLASAELNVQKKLTY